MDGTEHDYNQKQTASSTAATSASKLDALAEIAAAANEGQDSTGASVKHQSSIASKQSPTVTASPWKNRSDLQALWKKRYGQLLEYHSTHNHVNVPQRYSPNPELGRWVKDQRAFRRNNKLSKERIALLDKLGFIWKLKRPDDFWTGKLEQLKGYKRKFGTANPPREGEWNLLASWVDRQRRAGRKGKLTTERVRKLNELDFVWDPRGGDGASEVVGCDEVSSTKVSSERGKNTQSKSLDCSNMVAVEGPLYMYSGMGPSNTYQGYSGNINMLQQGFLHQMGSRMPYNSNMGDLSQGVMNYPMMPHINLASSPASFPNQSHSAPPDLTGDPMGVTQGSNTSIQGHQAMYYIPNHISSNAATPQHLNISPSMQSSFHHNNNNQQQQQQQQHQPYSRNYPEYS